jgi:hypothetical protein
LEDQKPKPTDFSTLLEDEDTQASQMIAFAPEKGTVAEFFRVDDHNPKFNKK